MLIIMVGVNCGTKGDVVKRSDCILVYGSTTKGDVVKRSDCIQGCCCKEVRLYTSVQEHYQG